MKAQAEFGEQTTTQPLKLSVLYSMKAPVLKSPKASKNKAMR